MEKTGFTFLAFEEKYPTTREALISRARENFRYVHQNGGSDKYSYSRLAAIFHECTPSVKWDQGNVRRFIEGITDKSKVALKAPSADEIVEFFKTSQKLKDEIENIFEQVLNPK